jgi:hypothetical protein
MTSISRLPEEIMGGWQASGETRQQGEKRITYLR